MSDVVVVGGGVVGLSFALAVHKRGFSVRLLRTALPPPANGGRYFALNRRSLAFLAELGVTPLTTTPVRQFNLHTHHRFLPIKSARQSSLCHIVAEDALLMKLTALVEAAAFSVISYKKINRQKTTATNICLAVDGTTSILASLLAIADGSRSPLADESGITGLVTDFKQTAIVGIFNLPALATHSAFQWFNDNDTVGLLPIGKGRFCLIWSTQQPMADADVVPQLMRRTGLADCQLVGDLRRFPLYAVRKAIPVGLRTALLGDALQTIHPLAGQGLNLGLRNADCLATCLRPADAGGKAGLGAYAVTTHRADWLHTATMLFAQSEKTVNAALAVAKYIPGIKATTIRLANS